LRQKLLIDAEDYTQLNALTLQWADYQEPKHFAEDYQVAELLQKSVCIPGVTDTEREEAALRKFLAAEARNAETNDRLMANTMPPWFGDVSSYVLEVLGPLGETELENIAESAGFGPGVNVGVRSEGLVPSIKFDTKPVCTEALLPVLEGLMPERVSDFWGVNLRSKTKVVDGNAHFTVPKSWKIKRCAAKEPLWNSYLQGGIGSHMVKRLRRFGVNLHEQGLNQALAEKALDWGLATIDLSSASDLMSRVLVWLLLCYNQCESGKRWFHLLSQARSPVMKIAGERKLLEMFSSMGNGFTFPLETIIFLSVVRSVVPRDEMCLCTCYGDDIIVPQVYARTVVERLEYLGFLVNSKKTCLAGTFFESCGTDWFLGQNVRPFYLHKDPDNPAPYPLQAANALRAWCLRIYGCLPRRFRALWQWCVDQVPEPWKNPVSPREGDVGIHCSTVEALKTRRSARCPQPRKGVASDLDYLGWEGYIVKFARVTPVYVDRKSFGVLTCGLRQLGNPTNSSIATRGREAVRGLYGRIRTETGVVVYDDFAWA
jgi:hypothetical protein